jgi:hypothetical protein
MAVTVVAFDPILHLKVRYKDQLYAVMLKDYNFFELPPDADVAVHFVTHEKIIVARHGSEDQRVKKTELIIVEPHIIE